MVSKKELIFSATKKDFKIDWFSGTGAGGQHRNKHQNCCRITHIETGLVAVGQTERDRPSNQKIAFRNLVKQLVEHYVKKEQRERYGSTETIRTYHQPDDRVVDHESGFRQSYGQVVGGKDIGDMIEARKLAIFEKLYK